MLSLNCRYFIHQIITHFQWFPCIDQNSPTALCWKTYSLRQGHHFGVWSIFLGRWLSTVIFCNLPTKLGKIWALGCHSVTLPFCCWQIGWVTGVAHALGSAVRKAAHGGPSPKDFAPEDGFAEKERLRLKGSIPSGVRDMWYASQYSTGVMFEIVLLVCTCFHFFAQCKCKSDAVQMCSNSVFCSSGKRSLLSPN